MRAYLLYYLIGGSMLLNFYFLYQLYSLKPNSDNDYNQDFIGFSNRIVEKKKDNEFLVIDWTGHQFTESDPIKCNFSHVTPDYCQSKLHSITNDKRRLHLIERCFLLSKIIIRWTADRSCLTQADLVAYHSLQMPPNNLPNLVRNDQLQQYSTVYVLESEVHSLDNQDWHKIDFPMWYNLERSYPAPATYFDTRIYLNQLFAPIRVPFSEKITNASIIWVISNCDAYNGRHLFVEKLMSYLRIDSYGKCLNNIGESNIQSHEQSNSIIYAKYKFVIAIENSNCEDYVTEKLIDAMSSTAIPIVASRNGKPDYSRFAPKYSYINIYDYKSVKELADYLNYLSKNETAYNEYLWFRQLPANKYAANIPSGIIERSLTENLRLADEILGVNATMRKWLLTKETSLNKYCKLAEFIHTTDWKVIYERKKINRPTVAEVCLPENDIVTYFGNSLTNI